jgi:hypothetical protein
MTKFRPTPEDDLSEEEVPSLKMTPEDGFSEREIQIFIYNRLDDILHELTKMRTMQEIDFQEPR